MPADAATLAQILALTDSDSPMLLWLVVGGLMALGPVIHSYIKVYDWFRGTAPDCRAREDPRHQQPRVRLYASTAFTTRASSTPVSRMSSPCTGTVKRAWSMPMQCRIVALSSFRCTGASTTL